MAKRASGAIEIERRLDGRPKGKIPQGSRQSVAGGRHRCSSLKSPNHITTSQLQPPLYPDTLEKRLVMADDEQCPVIGAQPGLNRSNRVDIEMIGRLVEDQQWRRC